MPAQFSFPPPGWPSNTVPSPSSSSHQQQQQQQYPSLPPPPPPPPQHQQSRSHKSRSHYQPDHNGQPYFPHNAIPYPSYPPPPPQPYFPSHSHPHHFPPPSQQQPQPPYPFVPIHHSQQPQPQHPFPPPFAYHPPPSPHGLQIQYAQSPLSQPQSFPRSQPTHQPPPPQQHQQPSHSQLQPVLNTVAPTTAYQPPAPSYRPNSHGQSAPTPTRPSQNQYPPAPLYGSQSQYQSQSRHQPNGTSSVPLPLNRYQSHSQSQSQYTSSAAQVYRHPPSHPPGQLSFFVPPPGQPTTDPSLSTPPKSQAQYTTYPSRLRTGITGLVQPEHITGGSKERSQLLAELDRDIAAGGRAGSGASTPRYDSPAPYATGGSGRRSAAAASSMLSGRRGRVVNYAEKASDDDDDDDDEDDEDSDQDEAASDPEDNSYGGRPVIRRGPGRPPKRDKERDSSLMIGGPEHQAAMRAGKAKRKRDEFERGLTWLGDRVPGERVKSEQVTGMTKHIYQSEELLGQAAERPELLVPITVDLEVPASVNDPNGQGIRIKDRFLWNINEPFIKPKSFAEIFCADIGIPTHHAETIASLIKAQVEEFQNTLEVDVLNDDVTEDNVIWSDDEVEDVMDADSPLTPQGEAGLTETKEIRGVSEGVDRVDEADEQIDAANGKEGKDKVWEEADCRIIINLDVQIYTHLLRDRIEWDLSSTLPPSIFAKQYCTELGLTGEAIPLVTIAIHEELLKHKKDALELELFAATHPEEQAKWERSNVLPKTNSRKGPKGLVGVWRDWYDREEFGPVLLELTFEEIASREQERVREARRVMRGLTTTTKRRR
ncbi:hypothetical protein IAT40_005455 [Kwoniella sp. CBS 6097]